MSTRLRVGTIAAALLVAAGITAGAAPAHADDSVGQRFTFTLAAAPAPCLTIANPSIVVPASTPLPFGDTRSFSSTVTSCADQPQSLAVSTSPAATVAGDVRWTPTSVAGSIGPGCSPASPLDRFGVLTANAPNPTLVLAEAPQPLAGTLAVDASLTKSWSVRTACEGSAGAGETLSVTITYLATLA